MRKKNKIKNRMYLNNGNNFYNTNMGKNSFCDMEV